MAERETARTFGFLRDTKIQCASTPLVRAASVLNMFYMFFSIHYNTNSFSSPHSDVSASLFFLSTFEVFAAGAPLSCLSVLCRWPEQQYYLLPANQCTQPQHHRKVTSKIKKSNMHIQKKKRLREIFFNFFFTGVSAILILVGSNVDIYIFDGLLSRVAPPPYFNGWNGHEELNPSKG